MTFCEDPPREGVIRLRCAYLELCTAISSRKRALPHGGHPLKYAASDSTMGQRRVGAVFAAIHAIEGHHRVLASHFIRRGNDKYKSCMSITTHSGHFRSSDNLGLPLPWQSRRPLVYKKSFFVIAPFSHHTPRSNFIEERQAMRYI